MPKDLAELSKAIDKNPKNSENYYLRADYYLNHGDIEKAKLDMFECLKLDDKTSKYYVLMSDIYFAEKETDETEEMLERAIALDPTNNEARLKLAELYFHLRMFPEQNSGWCVGTGKIQPKSPFNTWFLLERNARHCRCHANVSIMHRPKSD